MLLHGCKKMKSEQSVLWMYWIQDLMSLCNCYQIHLKCFLCCIIDNEVAPEMMVDAYNYIYNRKSLKCNYLEKKNLKKRKCFLQDVKENCLCIACTSSKSFLSLNDDLSLSAADYQWLTDSIFKTYIFKTFLIKIKMNENNQPWTFSFSLRNHNKRYQLYFQLHCYSFKIFSPHFHVF